MEKMKLKAHVISTDEKNISGNESYLAPYFPADPKYLYFPSKLPNGLYSWNSSSYIDHANSPADDGLGQLMFQRQELIFSKIEMLYCELYERYRIKEKNLYDINIDQCSFQNMIDARGNHLWDKNRLELERRIIDLENDKRREESNYFRDILFIRKELRESLIDKIEEKQKADLFTNQPEEPI